MRMERMIMVTRRPPMKIPMERTSINSLTSASIWPKRIWDGDSYLTRLSPVLPSFPPAFWGGEHRTGAFAIPYFSPRVLNCCCAETWLKPKPEDMSFIAWIPFGLQEHKTHDMEHPLSSPGWDWRGLSFPSRPLLGIPRSPICLSFPREEEVGLPWPTAHLKPKPGYIRLINWVCYITIYVFYSDIYKNTYVTGMFSSDITLSHVSRFWHQYCVLPAGPNNRSWPTIMFSRTISGLLYTFNSIKKSQHFELAFDAK